MYDRDSRLRLAALDARTFRVIGAYLVFVPLVASHLSGRQSIGASDLLFVFALALLLQPSAVSPGFAGIWFGIFVVVSFVGMVVHLVLPSAGGPTLTNLVLLLRMYAVFAPFFIVFRLRAFTRPRILRLLDIFLVSGTSACVVGIALYLAGVKVRDAQQVNFFGGGYSAAVRAGGLLGNSSDFGHLGAVLGTTAICIAALFRVRRWQATLVYTLALYTTYISSSRAAMLHLAIALILLLPVLLNARRVSLVCLGGPLVAAALVSLIGSIGINYKTSFVLGRLNFLDFSSGSQFYNSQVRLNTWSNLVGLFERHLFTGIGYDQTIRVTGYAGDNSFLTIFVETGLLSGLAYLLFWAWVVMKVCRAPNRRVRWVGIAMTLSEVSQMVTVDTHRMWSTTPLALLTIAIVVRIAMMPPGDIASLLKGDESPGDPHVASESNETRQRGWERGPRAAVRQLAP